MLLSKTTRTSKDGEVPSCTHAHDAGCAWGFLALQAVMMGYDAHGMAGIDRESAARGLGVPAEYRIEQMIAVGRRSDPASLSEQVRARERPNGRRPLAESAMEGRFRAG